MNEENDDGGLDFFYNKMIDDTQWIFYPNNIYPPEPGGFNRKKVFGHYRGEVYDDNY